MIQKTYNPEDRQFGLETVETHSQPHLFDMLNINKL